MSKQYAAVYVEWIDSFDVGGWITLDIHEWESPPVIKTVAWLIRQTDEYVVISHSDCNYQKKHERQTHGLMTIPRVAIKRMQTVVLPEAESNERETE